MAIIYATLIIKGKKTFADVPDKIKEKVREVLTDLDCHELAETTIRQGNYHRKKEDEK